MTSMTMRMKTLSYKLRISGPTKPMSTHHDHISNWYSKRDKIIYKYGGGGHFVRHLGYPRLALKMIKELDSWTQQTYV